MKTRKILSLVLVAVMMMSTMSIFSIGASADGAWDGKTADMSWFTKDKTAKSFEIGTAEQLYGLSVYVASITKTRTINNDGMIYLDANNKVIFDVAKIAEAKDVIDSNAEGWSNGYSVKLTADIDLGGHEFMPLGTSYAFMANFDGNGKTVKNFSIGEAGAIHTDIKNQRYYGFFGYLCGEVKDLTLENVTINISDINPANDVYLVLAGGLAATTWANNAASAAKNCKINGLTINFDPAGNISVKDYNDIKIGAAIGRLENGTENSVVVTDFTFNNKNTTEGINVQMAESMLYGAAVNAQTTPNFSANSSVTLKQAAPEQPGETPEQPGETPDTGDMTFAVVAVAVAAVMCSALVLKKREN